MAKTGGAYLPLRGTAGSGVAKAFRGKAGFKESQKLQEKFLPKKGIYTKQFKKSKKHSLREKLGVLVNRQSAIAIEQAGKGVTMQFTKSGVPFVPAGTTSSILTKAKGWAKITIPALTGTYLTREKKDTKKKEHNKPKYKQ